MKGEIQRNQRRENSPPEGALLEGRSPETASRNDRRMHPPLLSWLCKKGVRSPDILSGATEVV